MNQLTITARIPSPVTPRPLPPEVQLVQVCLDGVAPGGYEPCMVEIEECRPAGIRVRQGRRVSGWLSTSQLMVEVGELASLGRGVRLYVPTWMVRKERLEPLSLEVQRRERAWMCAKEETSMQPQDAQAEEQLLELCERAFLNGAPDVQEELARRATQDHHHSSLSASPAGERQQADVYAFAVTEHMLDMLEEHRFADVIAACEQWRRELADRALPPRVHSAIVVALIRAEQAAQRALNAAPLRLAYNG